MRNIVALSGGAGSAWVAIWASIKELNPILYFNDTKWEDEDLYRFNRDVSEFVGIPITEDTDGRNPEEVFYNQSFLGNNRVPLCSKILKAERLQKWVQPGDVVFFGIEPGEEHRATRIRQIYDTLGVNTRFPLIEEDVSKDEVFRYLEDDCGLKLPRMYREGFTHNNCAGGCVRAGKAHWKNTLRVRPEVFADRMRMEEDLQKYLGGNPTILKDMSLRELKELVEKQPEMDFGDPEAVECVGICNLEN